MLLGFLALSLDVGQILVEKRQLQNSADAAAMSLAKSCAKNNCVAGADSLADLVDNNANDKVSGIQSQCATNMPSTTAGGLRHHRRHRRLGRLLARCRRRWRR